MMEGVIFVVYNVCFDYSFLREEFKWLGYIYFWRNLCMVCLSCKVFLGLLFYSLGNFIKWMGWKVDVCYCVLDDVFVIVELLCCILVEEDN